MPHVRARHPATCTCVPDDAPFWLWCNSPNCGLTFPQSPNAQHAHSGQGRSHDNIGIVCIVVFAQVPRPRGDRSETQQNQRPANTRVNVKLFILDRNTARAVHRPPMQLLFEQSRDMRISDAAHLSHVLLRAPRAARAQTGRRRMPCRRPRRPPPRRRATSRP